jgi:hypothetical protein
MKKDGDKQLIIHEHLLYTLHKKTIGLSTKIHNGHTVNWELDDGMPGL